MIRAFKKWLAKAAYEGLQHQPDESRANRLHSIFEHNTTEMVAFKIDNGFVVRTSNDRTGFVYCPDHQAIADYIVSSAMKDRLGIQSEMFGKNDAAQQRKQVNIIPRSSQSQPHGY